MAAQINSKEDAINVLKRKVDEFMNEFGDAVDGDLGSLLKAFKSGELDDAQRDKIVGYLKTAIGNSWYNRLWNYGILIACIFILLFVFCYVGYYKLYKPLADKERQKEEKQVKKKIKKQEKHHIKKH